MDREDRINVRGTDGAQQQAIGLYGCERGAQLVRRSHVSHATETARKGSTVVGVTAWVELGSGGQLIDAAARSAAAYLGSCPPLLASSLRRSRRAP